MISICLWHKNNAVALLFILSRQVGPWVRNLRSQNIAGSYMMANMQTHFFTRKNLKIKQKVVIILDILEMIWDTSGLWGWLWTPPLDDLLPKKKSSERKNKERVGKICQESYFILFFFFCFSLKLEDGMSCRVDKMSWGNNFSQILCHHSSLVDKLPLLILFDKSSISVEKSSKTCYY